MGGITSSEGKAQNMSPLTPPYAARPPSQGLGPRGSRLLLPSHQGPEVSRSHHQTGRGGRLTALPPQDRLLSPKGPRRLADTSLPAPAAREGGEGRLRFHFLRNSRFSNCGCYGRHRSAPAWFLSAFIAIRRARALTPRLAAKDSCRRALVK